MYEELVKALRNCGDTTIDGCIGCAYEEPQMLCSQHLMTKAADAIEELQEDNAELNGTVSNLIGQIAELSKPRWIPVTERLPEKHQWCLVVGENLYDMDFINSQGAWHMHDKPFLPIDYWMPLPEPPKGE